MVSIICDLSFQRKKSEIMKLILVLIVVFYLKDGDMVNIHHASFHDFSSLQGDNLREKRSGQNSEELLNKTSQFLIYRSFNNASFARDAPNFIGSVHKLCHLKTL